MEVRYIYGRLMEQGRPLYLYSAFVASAKVRFINALNNNNNNNLCPVVSSSFFLLFSSPNLSHRRLDVCHTSKHGVALVRIYDAGLKCACLLYTSPSPRD